MIGTKWHVIFFVRNLRSYRQRVIRRRLDPR